MHRRAGASGVSVDEAVAARDKALQVWAACMRALLSCWLCWLVGCGSAAWRVVQALWESRRLELAALEAALASSAPDARTEAQVQELSRAAARLRAQQAELGCTVAVSLLMRRLCE